MTTWRCLVMVSLLLLGTLSSSVVRAKKKRPTTRPKPPSFHKNRPLRSQRPLRSSSPSTLWESVRDYWSPRVRFVWKANREYWTPPARFVWRANREYWSRKAKALLEANRDFWPPRARFVMKANRKYWLPRIERLYLPAIRSRYRELNERYGKKLSQDYRDLMQHLSPMVTQYPVYWFRSSWKRFPAGFRQAIRQVPAPLKKTLDRYHSWSLRQMHRWRGTLQNKAPSEVKTSLMHLAKAMRPSHDRRLNLRIHKAFERIRPHAADASMRSCYRIVPLDSPIINAFNTGCTTYITSALAKKLTDLELSAVLAHEVAHGDQGHAVKNLLILSKSAGKHMFRLVVDEARWLLTGRWSKHLQTVVNKGHLTPLLQSFGKKAPAIELEADIGAVGILKRAKISPQHLIHALMKLHGKTPGSKVKKNLKDLDGLRDYPSLYRRIQAVRKAAK